MRPTVSQILALLGLVHHSLADHLPAGSSDSDKRPIPVSDNNATSTREPLFPYTRKELGPNSIACNAGSRQYVGKVTLSDEKKILYWFIESRNDAENSPVTVKLAGGPGSSSLRAIFNSIGPCSINERNDSTVYENTTWTEFTNLLFVDQPAGVGWSATIGAEFGFIEDIPNNLPEATEDFYNFLLTFFHDVLPQYASNKLHFFGTSFGGIYVPAFVDYINSQRGHPNNTIPKVASIILEDPCVDGFTAYNLALFAHHCNPAAPRTFPLFNDSICNELEIIAPQCERSAALCREKLDPETCKQAGTVCNRLKDFSSEIMGDLDMEVYDDRYTERDLPPVIKPSFGGDCETFLNNDTVKEELGVGGVNGPPWMYSGSNDELLREWEKSGAYYVPSTNNMERILNMTDTRVLVLNGNNDGLVTTVGQKRVFDSLVWRRQASYRMHEFVDWSYPLQCHANGQDVLVKGGQWKKTDDGPIKDKLAFFTVDEAGHLPMDDQREATTWLVGCWMGMRKGDKRCPV
ncbi:Alpha/Beta hydrolase fold [Rhypophila decipiens]